MLAEVDRLRAAFDHQRAHSLRQMPRSLEEVLTTAPLPIIPCIHPSHHPLQVLTMAAYLAMPHGGEIGTEHLWIADAALCLQLPLGWIEHEDEADGHKYYANVVTEERLWEHPQLAFLRGVVEAVSARANHTHQLIAG